MGKKRALLLGATGLVGCHLLSILLEKDDYEKVVALTRRPLHSSNPKLEIHTIDFNRISDYGILFQEVDTVFCTLGTTMKVAKTKEQFMKVDYHFPLSAAMLAKEHGVSQFFLVTSMGANPHSRNFYSQVKGKIEEAIKQLQFPTLYLIRPSLLLGEREQRRFAEDIAQAIFKRIPKLFQGPLQKVKPNEGSSVASAMYNLSLKREEGTFIVESLGIERNKLR